LLDRIDIHIEVPRVDYEKLSADRVGESSDSIRARVQAARDLQLNCFSKKTDRLTLSVMLTCGLGKSSGFASYLSKVKA
jgi:predicted ATPase with chaperone activity